MYSGHANRTEAADPADVVAGEIDEHEVFGQLLFIGEEFLFEGQIVGDRCAAFAGAGDGADFHQAVGQAHMHLRARRRRSQNRRPRG
jgi:hypothetical protein